MNTRVTQIQAAYAAEEGHRTDPVHKARDLPLSYDAITAEWLADALGGGVPGAKVVQFALGPVDTGSSNRRKIALTWNATGQAAGLPTRLFCKATHDLANRVVLGISGGAMGEVDFFNHVRPLLDFEAPQSYFAGYNPANINSIVVLRDISDEVTSFCDHNTEMTLDRAKSQMRLLARAHGQGYSNPAVQQALKAIVTWPEFFMKTLDFGMEAGSTKGFMDGKDVIPARTWNRHAEVWEKSLASVNRHKHLPLTLMHGDVHLKNWYIAGNGEMGLGDWQCVSRGHWSRDVCYAISSALTVEHRRAWERELLAFYLDELAASGGPKVALDDALLDYRQQLMTALTWWTITLAPTDDIPDMQPRDITLEMVRRIGTACDDWDSLDSF
ncbi:phosphotransferase [Novosphingobium lentum]|uniref:phosphotransferase n=1 Tax=Novosphingobium lentum TaxID=145287 RepID=UPI00082D2DDE|nr:phosphotransferase [Novosphingobium lentum]